MDSERQNFIDRLTAFLNHDFEKGELNDREEIKDRLIEELKEY